jgi:hypothetical protein
MQRLLPDNTQQSQQDKTYMLPAGFKPTIRASKWLQTHAVDCAATGIGRLIFKGLKTSQSKLQGFQKVHGEITGLHME